MAARTIRLRVEHEIAKRKGSRFIAAAWPLDSDSNGDRERDSSSERPRQAGGQLLQLVRAMLDERSALFPSACHHCYAYTTMDGREYCSDDGEPHGTAGKPILVALQRAKLVDVCIVVSRIFGGTKLGTGGLIRAYGASAQEAIDLAEVIDKVPTTTLRLVASFAHVDVVKQCCTKFVAEILAQEYASHAEFVVRVPNAHAEVFRGVLQSRSSGGVKIHYASACRGQAR